MLYGYSTSLKPKQDEALNSIIKEYNPYGSGKNLLSKTTGVDSVDDVCFSQNDKEVIFYFGKREFSISRKDLFNPNTLNTLKLLELNVSAYKGKLLIKFRDTLIREVVE